MARPREFDEASALDAAMDCFWRDGYEATSVRDLAARMGITGASLYNAFGDKRSLFREVLQRYAERSTRERIARLESTLPPKQAIRAFLDAVERGERPASDTDELWRMLGEAEYQADASVGIWRRWNLRGDPCPAPVDT